MYPSYDGIVKELYTDITISDKVSLILKQELLLCGHY